MKGKEYNGIWERGVITESEVRLMRRRLNHGASIFDVFSIFFGGNLKITEEQTKKGLAWLKNLWISPTGKIRKRNPFDKRKMCILARFHHFELVSFMNRSGSVWTDDYYPVYRVVDDSGRYFDYIARRGDDLFFLKD